MLKSEMLKSEMLKSEMQGVVAFSNGSVNPLSRDGTRGTILVPSGTNTLDIWFSVIDDNIPPTSLSYNKVKFSDNLFDFHLKPELSLTVVNTPLMEVGYYVSQTVEYYHKITYEFIEKINNFNTSKSCKQRRKAVFLRNIKAWPADKDLSFWTGPGQALDFWTCPNSDFW